MTKRFQTGDSVAVKTDSLELQDMNWIYPFSSDMEWTVERYSGNDRVWLTFEESGAYNYRVCLPEGALRHVYTEMPSPLVLIEPYDFSDRAYTLSERLNIMNNRIEAGYYTVKTAQKFGEVLHRTDFIWGHASRHAWAEQSEDEKAHNRDVYMKDLFATYDLSGAQWGQLYPEADKEASRVPRSSRWTGDWGDDWLWWVKYRAFKQVYFKHLGAGTLAQGK